MAGTLRRMLIGLPLPSARMVHKRLSKVQALAVLSSDALSSVAYATEEILLVLILAGSGALGLSWLIALAIGDLLLIVAISYYQTVHAYPTGGGAYTVSKVNLGALPSLVAGAALLTDYILTVAVSISAGVVATTKFSHGAWFILLLIPTLVVIFRVIHRHYEDAAQQLSLSNQWPTPVRRHPVIVPVADLHRGVVKAVYYGQMLGGELHAVTVEVDPEATAALPVGWNEALPSVPLEIIPSPYRSVTEPLIEFVDQFVQAEGDYVTVILPEFVPAKLWHHLLHNQTARALKSPCFTVVATGRDVFMSSLMFRFT